MNLIGLLSLVALAYSRPSPERIQAFKNEIKTMLYEQNNKCVTAVNNYYSQSLTYPYNTWATAAWQDLNDIGSVKGCDNIQGAAWAMSTFNFTGIPFENRFGLCLPEECT